MPPDPESVSLPEPPPPRPAARDAAIEAAMRRYDDAGEPPAASTRPVPWRRRPEFQFAMAASLALIIGIPAALIGIRDQGPGQPTTPPLIAENRAQADQGTADVGLAEPSNPSSSEQSAHKPATVGAAPAREVAKAPTIAPAVNEAAPVASPPPAAAERYERYAAPAPPPPAPQALAQKSADARSSGVVITGTRIPQPNLTSASPVTVLDDRAAKQGEAERYKPEPYRFNGNPSYATFMTRLQTAVRANDRDGVIALIRFPLRVNSNGRHQLYRDASSVRASYDRIFTSKVTRAILGQRTDAFFGNQNGVMIGNGEVWFDQLCPNAACSPSGDVRITSINP